MPIDEEFNKNLLGKRLKTLRLSHNLSTKCLANIVKFKSQGSIANIEAGINFPSFESAFRICNLFAVSLDWLSGKITEAYHPDIILSLEKNLLEKATNTTDKNLKYFKYITNSFIFRKNDLTYIDNDKREIRYTLPVRANIIFCINIFYYMSLMLSASDEINYEEENFITINDYLISNLKKQKNGNTLYNLNKTCLYLFEKYLNISSSNNIDSKIPYFNIETFKEY